MEMWWQTRAIKSYNGEGLAYGTFQIFTLIFGLLASGMILNLEDPIHMPFSYTFKQNLGLQNLLVIQKILESL
jgi:hypothetical protein